VLRIGSASASSPALRQTSRARRFDVVTGTMSTLIGSYPGWRAPCSRVRLHPDYAPGDATAGRLRPDSRCPWRSGLPGCPGIRKANLRSMVRDAGSCRCSAPRGRPPLIHDIEQPSRVSVALPHRARRMLPCGAAREPSVRRPYSSLPLPPAVRGPLSSLRIRLLITLIVSLLRRSAPKGCRKATHCGIELPSSVSVALPQRAGRPLPSAVADERRVLRRHSPFRLVLAAQRSSQACESSC
jgi:hypothetical protein